MLIKNNYGGMVIVTCDGGAGSSGKGSFNSWLADNYNFNIATNNWSTNAGHYTQRDDGVRILVQHIPSSFVDKNTELYINAGAAIDLETLLAEIRMLEELGYDISNRLTIHPHANVITKADKQREKELLKSGSTFKGCGAALASKTMRMSKLAKDYEELEGFIDDRTEEINKGIPSGLKILVEGSQGVDLDINHAEYPYTTSRQTTPAQLIADAGLPCHAITNTIINLRTNPIRISNQSAAVDGESCYSGNYWDAKEISWEDVAAQAGFDSLKEFEERYGFAILTSVTKKTRRVFEFPRARMRYVHALCGGLLPDGNVLYSLNFINFIDKAVAGVKTKEELFTDKITRWLDNNLFNTINVEQLRWIRTGPKHSELVEL